MKKKIMFVAGRTNFPDDGAGSRRIGMLARCLSDSKFDVDLKFTSKRTNNAATSGVYHNITYEYFEKNIVVPRNFLSKLNNLIGLSVSWRTFLKLYKICKNEKYDYLFIYTRDIFLVAAAYCIKKRFRIPLIMEVCEWPAYSPSSNIIVKIKKYLFCNYSIYLADGAIPISTFIEKEIRNIIKKQIKLLRIPILYDVKEFSPSYTSPSKYLAFSGGDGYPDILNLIIESFAKTKHAQKDFELMFIGMNPEHNVVKELKVKAKKWGVDDKLLFPGFVPWDEYQRLLSSATAHLIPLPSDQRSAARFPNKIAEYLATGRPIICSNVGDVGLYFSDKQNAFIVQDTIPMLFAKKIDDVISSPAFAAKVGLEGRKTAQENFDYRCYTKKIAPFLHSL